MALHLHSGVFQYILSYNFTFKRFLQQKMFFFVNFIMVLKCKGRFGYVRLDIVWAVAYAAVYIDLLSVLRNIAGG